mmetsp:Transcript_9384/g.35132  ORF Transcript_9384/g.35132 Transcript_9384/m.35132 type:complete len:259 (-) Transcript_9384:67-843(-)
MLSCLVIALVIMSQSSAATDSETTVVCTPVVKRTRGGNEPEPATERLLTKRPRNQWKREVSLEDLRGAMASFAQERDWDQFHTPRNIMLALVGEVGELAELFQWAGDAKCDVGLPSWEDKERVHLGEELSDVLLYLVRLADRCDIDLPAAVLRKMEKNKAKYPASKVRGSSRKYNQYQSEKVWEELSCEEVVQAASLVGLPKLEHQAAEEADRKEELLGYLTTTKDMDRSTARAMLVRVANTLAKLKRDVDVAKCSEQ